MVVIDKCREYCRRMSTSEEHYQFLLESIHIFPSVRNKECRRPENLCENCDLNKFNIDRFNKLWTERINKSLE